MSNPEKSRRIYRKIVGSLEDLARGNIVPDLENTLSKAHLLFLSGYHPPEEDKPSDYFAAPILTDITDYYTLRRKRARKVIAGGEREITTEDEALESLKLVESISRNLILPYFTRRNSFSNSIFKDIHNLGLAYLHSIVGAVADEYIPNEEARMSKLVAVDLAKGALREVDQYFEMDEVRMNMELKKKGRTFRNLLSMAQLKYIRSFELVPTDQKHIHHGNRLMKQLQDEITEKDETGDFRFAPRVIFPIAQGGNEFGIRLSMAYEDKGHLPVTYPLFYSIKTRKHRYPWIGNDSDFLGKSLEGEDLLIVEDWVTTGNTLRGILNQLENVYPREIRIATLKRDKEKSIVPILDRYQFYVGSWAIYNGDKTDSLSEMD